MPAKHLEASVRQERGGTVLDLRGEINDFAQEPLNAAYAEAEAKDPEAIILNFGRVDYIDSAGIVLIGNLLAKARASKRRLLVYGLSNHYVEIFDITRLSDFVSIFPDEESALSGASAS
jgi:anti-sigma B factor antagonist